MTLNNDQSHSLLNKQVLPESDSRISRAVTDLATSLSSLGRYIFNFLCVWWDSNQRPLLTVHFSLFNRYGLDADLMVLGLASHEPNFCLLREEVKFGGRSDKVNSIALITIVIVVIQFIVMITVFYIVSLFR